MSKESPTKEPRKLKAKKYEKELRQLQAELCKLQDWVKHKGLRVIIVFEGRDGAGKGGTIRAITERASPRVFRLAALPAPSDREKSQMYMQRYMAHFPAAKARTAGVAETSAGVPTMAWDSMTLGITAITMTTITTTSSSPRCRSQNSR